MAQPPSDDFTRPGRSTSIAKGDPLWRAYHRDHYNPKGDHRRAWGPTDARFDHHPPGPPGDGSGCAIIYVGDSGLAHCCTEMFGGAGQALICPLFHVTLLFPKQRVETQDVVGQGATDLGAEHHLGTYLYDDPSEPQAWARAIYLEKPAGDEICGIHYESSHTGGGNYALWETAPDLGTLFDLALVDDVDQMAALTLGLEELNIVLTCVEQESCEICLDHGLVAEEDFVKAN